ncbi:hypothetical protein BJY04DRAFT_217931 [Aspergillus karnatakaensis]|uniref:uncharacterized protein n=1 Tax=Aspergillus karnatakaensis TaxID=1810916 RepID=UPI003CCCCC91
MPVHVVVLLTQLTRFYVGCQSPTISLLLLYSVIQPHSPRYQWLGLGNLFNPELICTVHAYRGQYSKVSDTSSKDELLMDASRSLPQLGFRAVPRDHNARYQAKKGAEAALTSATLARDDSDMDYGVSA